MHYAETVKAKVEDQLARLGLRHADLIRKLKMSTSTYYDMWKNGYVTVDRLIGMADVLGVPAAELLPDAHRGEVLHRKPEGRPYVEDRLEQLEREVRGMRAELKRLK